MTLLVVEVTEEDLGFGEKLLNLACAAMIWELQKWSVSTVICNRREQQQNACRAPCQEFARNDLWRFCVQNYRLSSSAKARKL